MTTPPKIKKLFISYRSSDAAKVDKIARDLALLKYDDGTPRYITWQDKHNLPPASPNWWDAIVDAIENCDIFVFHLSRESLQSASCRAELEYAHKRNRLIIPVVLVGEFFLNAESGKYDLPKETWALVPEWLGQTQFLFYVGAQFYVGFQSMVELFERQWPRDIRAPRPLNPYSKNVHDSNHALYSAACDYAERLAFTDAEKHFDALVRRNDEDYADLAELWLKIIRGYAELIEILEKRIPAKVFDKRWNEYRALFPNDVYQEIFDPKNIASREPKPEEITTEKTKQERPMLEKTKQERKSTEKGSIQDNQKTVFISYRRKTSQYLARSIYQDLKMNGWDVFLDVNTIDNGDFDRIILNQIGARVHFILLISPDSLQRCASTGDWVLREIEEAVRLERNIVPLIEEGADFNREMAYLPHDLRAAVSKKSGIPIVHFFFDSAMDILRTRFLKTPEYVRVIEVSADERTEVQRRMNSIDGAAT